MKKPLSAPCALLLAILAAGCGSRAAAAPQPGDRFPAIGLVADAGPQLVWVLRPEDYLRCNTAATHVRRFQARHGAAVPLTVLYVGEHPEWAREFLRRQRLRASLVEVDAREFKERFGQPAGAWVHLLVGREVRGTAPTGDFAGLERMLTVQAETVLAQRGGSVQANINDTHQETR